MYLPGLAVRAYDIFSNVDNIDTYRALHFCNICIYLLDIVKWYPGLNPIQNFSRLNSPKVCKCNFEDSMLKDTNLVQTPTVYYHTLGAFLQLNFYSIWLA